MWFRMIISLSSVHAHTGRYDAVVMCGAYGVESHVTEACFPELIRITKPGTTAVGMGTVAMVTAAVSG